MARIIWTKDALRQLDILLTPIAQDDPAMSFRVADKIDESVSRLREFPESAPIHRKPLRRLSVRGLPVSCYYICSGDTVRIIHVRHDHQTPLQ